MIRSSQNAPLNADHHLTRGSVRGRVLTLGLTVMFAALAGGVTPVAFGQDTTSAAAKLDAAKKDAANLSLLTDFIHYTRIQNHDLAEALGNELLGKKLSNEEFVALVDSSGDVARFEETLQRAMRVTQLETVAAGLSKAFETGKLERARNPEQVAKNIALLTTTDRGRRMGEERLVYAGEYAMPQLIEALLDRSQPQRQAAVQRVIVGMGRNAVIPMVTALMKVSPPQQELIADVLGLIPHKTSLPFLRDLAASTTLDSVRTACDRAYARITGTDASSGASDAASLYRMLGEAYYAERTDITAFPGEDYQLLWDYEPSTGLVMTAIKTPVYHEAMAMRLAERAMQIESAKGGASPETLALWVASNFSRETDTPANYTNPAYPTSGAKARRSAEYYAVAAGADIAQRVLRRALTDRDTPLARKAIAAVEKTAGGKDLWSADGAAADAPLLQSLNYPNRRVQFEAALALAAAQPEMAFPGSDRVVPTLAATVKGATTQYAVILSPDAELYQTARSVLNKLGYTVLPQGRAISDLTAAMSEAPSIDLVITTGINGDNIAGAVTDVRGQSKTLATPILVLTDSQSYADLRRRYASDGTVAIRQSGVGESAVTESIRQLVERASGGPISEAEAGAYATRSLAALRDLAVSRNTVLNAGDATLPLIAALNQLTGDTKIRVAEILSRTNQERAQRAVMDSALAATGAERVTLLGLVSDSGKRFGNFLEASQVTQLRDLATKGADAEATAAASLIGTLNLAKTELVPLILNRK